MTNQRAVASYRQVHVSTAAPLQRVVMMYDGAVRFLQGALAAFDRRTPDRFEAIHLNVQSAENVLIQLQLALDLRNGGGMAQSLNELYAFWIRHLSDGNVRKDPRQIQEVLTMVSDLRDTWATAANEARKQGLS